MTRIYSDLEYVAQDMIAEHGDQGLHPRTKHIHSDDELAQGIVSRLSTMRAVKLYLVITAIYCGGNELFKVAFDRYPFPFYTFSVSVLAIVLTLLVLVATDLQDRKNRKRDELQAREVDELHVMNRQQLEMLTEVRAHIQATTPSAVIGDSQKGSAD